MALNADFVYSMPVSAFAGPLVFNFGGEYRREGFKIGAGEPNSYSGGSWATPDPFGFCTDQSDFGRSEEHTSELQSLMRISYAVFCLKKKTYIHHYSLYNT